MILCDASAPGESGGVYTVPYVEAVDGRFHGYMTRRDGVAWVRSADHPADPKCPECATG
jgi:hypothetical protein